MLKAIIFDLDETLLDWKHVTEDWETYERKHLGYVFEYVEQNVYPLKDLEQFLASARDKFLDVWEESRVNHVAPHLGDVLMDLLVQQGLDRTAVTIEEIITAYRAEPMTGIATFPEVRQELDTLRRAGLRFGVATNAIQPMSMRDVELLSLGLMEFFEDGCRLSAADVGYLKPHPKIFETALTCLNAKPEEAVFVGDSLAADIVGAQQVGMKAILRTRLDGGTLFPQAFGTETIIPDGTITSLNEIYPLLDAWYPEWKDGG